MIGVVERPNDSARVLEVFQHVVALIPSPPPGVAIDAGLRSALDDLIGAAARYLARSVAPSIPTTRLEHALRASCVTTVHVDVLDQALRLMTEHPH